VKFGRAIQFVSQFVASQRCREEREFLLGVIERLCFRLACLYRSLAFARPPVHPSYSALTRRLPVAAIAAAVGFSVAATSCAGFANRTHTNGSQGQLALVHRRARKLLLTNTSHLFAAETPVAFIPYSQRVRCLTEKGHKYGRSYQPKARQLRTHTRTRTSGRSLQKTRNVCLLTKHLTELGQPS